MAKARRITATILVALLALAVLTANAAPKEREATVVLHIANHAEVPSAMLATAMKRVADVYDRIGVGIDWNTRGATISRVQDGQLHLSVLLLTREMTEKKTTAERVSPSVWGQAHLPSGRAYVHYYRIADIPEMPATLAARLGDVIAHEVGHLLLRAGSHSKNGIMRASLAVHSILPQSFNGTQARTIRARLMASTLMASK